MIITVPGTDHREEIPDMWLVGMTTGPNAVSYPDAIRWWIYQERLAKQHAAEKGAEA